MLTMKTLLQIFLILTLTSFQSTTNSLSYNSKPPVEIKVIKNLPNIITTSGVLPTKESEKLCKQDTIGFFGRYTLVHRHRTNSEPIFGHLIVYVKGKAAGWKYNNNNETFAQLTLTSSKIKLWNKIHIGTSEKELINFIDKNFHYKKGIFIFSEIGEYSLECRIIADTINKITVSKYCKAKK